MSDRTAVDGATSVEGMDATERTIHGRLIPDHIEMLPARRWVELVCTDGHESPRSDGSRRKRRGPWKLLAWHDPTDGDLGRLDEFLRKHTHEHEEIDR